MWYRCRRSDGAMSLIWGCKCTSTDNRNLEFLAFDYGGRLHLPAKLRHRMGEWGNAGKNQCSIIHLAAGVEWHLQNRPIRFTLKARVQNMASELRGLEYNRESQAKQSTGCDGRLRGKSILAVSHDIVHAHRGRDFRFRPLFNGGGNGPPCTWHSYFGVESEYPKTRMYNYQRTGEPTKEPGAVYLMAHRGRRIFAKQSHLATEVRWGKWRNEFSQVIDVDVLTWGIYRIRTLWNLAVMAGNAATVRDI